MKNKSHSARDCGGLQTLKNRMQALSLAASAMAPEACQALCALILPSGSQHAGKTLSGAYQAQRIFMLCAQQGDRKALEALAPFFSKTLGPGFPWDAELCFEPPNGPARPCLEQLCCGRSCNADALAAWPAAKALALGDIPGLAPAPAAVLLENAPKLLAGALACRDRPAIGRLLEALRKAGPAPRSGLLAHAGLAALREMIEPARALTPKRHAPYGQAPRRGPKSLKSAEQDLACLHAFAAGLEAWGPSAAEALLADIEKSRQAPLSSGESFACAALACLERVKLGICAAQASPARPKRQKL